MTEIIPVPYTYESLVGKPHPKLGKKLRGYRSIDGRLKDGRKYHLELQGKLMHFLVTEEDGKEVYSTLVGAIPDKIWVLGYEFIFQLVDAEGLLVLDAKSTNDELKEDIRKIARERSENPESLLIDAIIRLLGEAGDRDLMLKEIGVALNCKVINVKEEPLIGEGR